MQIAGYLGSVKADNFILQIIAVLDVWVLLVHCV